MHFNYSLTILFLFLFNSLLSQTMRPGDVNNNGIVNKIDLLYLGYAYGAEGPAREVVDETWETKNLPTNWNFSFPNGLNFAYADCNGDGVINEEDAKVIDTNAGLSHGDVLFQADPFMEGIPNQDPSCSFLNPPATIPVGQTFFLEIGLGNGNIPIENLGGLTFTLNIEPDIVGISTAQITFNQDSWLEVDTNRAISLQKIDELRAELEIGLTKTDQIPVSGGGAVATVSFLIIDDVIDLLVSDTVTFILDSITVLDNELQPILIVADTLYLKIDRDLMVSATDVDISTTVDVFPNPTKETIFFSVVDQQIQKAVLVNSLGQVLLSKTINGNSGKLSIANFPDQLYWLKLHTKKGVLIRPIQKI